MIRCWPLNIIRTPLIRNSINTVYTIFRRIIRQKMNSSCVSWFHSPLYHNPSTECLSFNTNKKQNSTPVFRIEVLEEQNKKKKKKLSRTQQYVQRWKHFEHLNYNKQKIVWHVFHKKNKLINQFWLNIFYSPSSSSSSIWFMNILHTWPFFFFFGTLL